MRTFDLFRPAADAAGQLRRLRLLHGMKQSHLAALLGVDQATVSRWERGVLALSPRQRAKLARLFAASASAQDAALRRLVESSTQKVHLICDRTHRLFAASRARQAEWRADPAEFLGRPLLGYASAEILAAEATLRPRGWHEGRLSSLVVETGANADPVLRILPGRVLWERILLGDGSAARLVTTIG
jgi:transcriptional regulator with XRE-family HTH domain